MDVHGHYQGHLAPVYSWMFGDFDAMVQRQTALFRQEQVEPHASKVALDLGCGSGFQSLALAGLGFQVHAVDWSQALLDELKQREPRILTHHQDLQDLSFAKGLHPELIACMGDTLTHLPEPAAVSRLLRSAFDALAPGGHCLLSFRDLSQARQDLDRFFVVHSDEQRILTCFLEDEGDRVKVHDLLHEKNGAHWTLKNSYYHKLKLAAHWVGVQMEEAGFHVTQSSLPSGLVVLKGRKN